MTKARRSARAVEVAGWTVASRAGRVYLHADGDVGALRPEVARELAARLHKAARKAEGARAATMPGPDDDNLDQPDALQRAAEVLGLPVEDLARMIEADRRLAAELAELPNPVLDELRALGPDPLAAELAALPAPGWPTIDDVDRWAADDAALARKLATDPDPEDLPDAPDPDPDDGGRPC
jgi:hypothetical protein